jgi:hypothetical protein
MALTNKVTKKGGAIAAGASLSSALSVSAGQITGLYVATWTAAVMTFQTSVDKGTTWINLYDDAGNEVSVTPTAAKFCALDAGTFGGITYLKCRSGTSGAAVNQVVAVTVQISSRILGYAG